METTTLGSLAIVTETADKKAVERELRKLDPNLFIDFFTDPRYGLIPQICERLSAPPYVREIVVWQEADGRPKPICFAMVEELKRRERTRASAVRDALAANERRKDGLRKRAADDYGALQEEHQKRIRAAELDSLPPGWRPKNFHKK